MRRVLFWLIVKLFPVEIAERYQYYADIEYDHFIPAATAICYNVLTRLGERTRKTGNTPRPKKKMLFLKERGEIGKVSNWFFVYGGGLAGSEGNQFNN